MTNYTPKKAILLALMLLMSALTAQMMIAGFAVASDSEDDHEEGEMWVEDGDFDEYDDWEEWEDPEDDEDWDELDDSDWNETEWDDFEDWEDFDETEIVQWELESLKEFANELEAEGVDVTAIREKIAEAEALASDEMSEEEIDHIWEVLEEAWDAIDWDSIEWEYEEEDLTDEELHEYYLAEKEYLDDELEELLSKADELGVAIGDIGVILEKDATELTEEDFDELEDLFMGAWTLVADDIYDEWDDWEEYDNETIIELYWENLEYAEEYIEFLKEEGEDTSEYEALLEEAETLLNQAEANIDNPDVFDDLVDQIGDLVDDLFEIEGDDCWTLDGEDCEFTAEELLEWYNEDLEYLDEIAEELENAGGDTSDLRAKIEEIKALVEKAVSEAPDVTDETIAKIEESLEAAFDSIEWDNLFDDEYIIEFSEEDLAEVYRSNLDWLNDLKNELAEEGFNVDGLDEVIQDYSDTLEEAIQSGEFEEYIDDLEDILDDAWDSVDWEDYEEEVLGTV